MLIAYLERGNPERNEQRFYAIHFVDTLLGLAVMRMHGRKGAWARVLPPVFFPTRRPPGLISDASSATACGAVTRLPRGQKTPKSTRREPWECRRAATESDGEQQGFGNGISRAAIQGEFTLLLPEALLGELVRAIARKPYLRERIRPEEMAQLANILQSVAEVIPYITDPIPAVTRGPKDDYLIAYALVGAADYPVTGNKDLLVLEEVGTLRILTPRAFWSVLNQRRRGG